MYSMFLTSYCAVLMMLAHNPRATVREISRTTGLTERRVQSILATLCGDGYICAERVGRGKRYMIELEKPVGQGPWGRPKIADLIHALSPTVPTGPGGSPSTEGWTEGDADGSWPPRVAIDLARDEDRVPSG